MANYKSLVDGIEYDNDPATNTAPNPSLVSGRKLKYIGQTSNTASGNVSNKSIGTVALTAVNAGATGSVTISDSTIASTSLIFLTVKDGPTADSGAGRGVVVWTGAPSSGSVTIYYTPLISMVNSWALHYWVIN